MDEMKLKVSTIFMRSFVAKMIKDFIYKKYRYKVDIQLNKLDIEVIDGKARIRTDIEASTDNDELINMLKNIM